MENPSTPLSDPDDWLYDALGAERSEAGVRVGRERALTVSAFWRGINLVSADVAKIAPFVYRRTDSGKVRATEHPAYQLLKYKPNAEMTSFAFFQTLVGHRLVEGNGYARIVRRGDGAPIELIPLDPTRTYPVRVNGVLWYGYDSDKGMMRFAASDVLHFKGLSYDGLRGYSVLAKAREALGLEMATREHGARFFANGARVGVMLEHPAQMSPEAQARFLAAWKRYREGTGNSWKTLLLEEGLKVSAPLTMNANDAQMLESRDFSVREMANFIGVPPHKVGDVSTKTYASLEQEDQAYLNSTLDPILVSIELELREKLLTEEQKADDSHVIEFHRQSLVRVDMRARYESYSSGLAGMPWLTINEVRAMENLNGLEGYDALHVPINMQQPDMEDPGEQPEVEPETDTPDAEGGDPAEAAGAMDRARGAAQKVLTDAKRRLFKRIGAAARKAAKSPGTFGEWLRGYRAEHRETVRGALMPCAELLAALDGADPVVLEEQLAGQVFAAAEEVLEPSHRVAVPEVLAQVVDEGMARLEA